MPAILPRRYRVLSLRNDVAIVKTEADETKEIPLIDQAGFRDRIHNEVRSGPENVYVIVIEDGKSELAVDYYIHGRKWHHRCLLSGNEANRRQIQVCDYFKLWIQYHTIDSIKSCDTAPVGSFIYNQAGPNANQIAAVELENWAKHEVHIKPRSGKTKNRFWRWVHLPANNKTWVKDIISALRYNREMSRKWDIRELQMFIDESYHEIRGPAAHACLRRPLFTQFPDPKRTEIFSLVIPYFDAEDLNDHIHHGDRKPATITNDHQRERQELKNFYEDLHVPCTLDQSYYLSLDDPTERNKTQIVVKYAQRQANTEPKKLLMVNQMWLWKIDSYTFITAFPGCCRQDMNADLLRYISETMKWDPPPTPDSTIIRLLQSVIGFVDGPNNAGLDENVFDIFEQSIALQAQLETQRYKEFQQAQQEQRKKIQEERTRKNTQALNSGFLNANRNRPGPGFWDRLATLLWGKSTADNIDDTNALPEKDLNEEMCDITQEVENIREIKDIKDELRMIQRVLEDQETVLTQYTAVQTKGESLALPEKNRLASLKQSLDFRIAKLQRLVRDASSVEDSLNHLLDIKQKQGNLNEARDTRKLANEADNRAKDSETQNQLLFVFTIITVVFTPVSFASSFLAVPSRDFPQSDSGDAVSWSWWQIFAAAMVTEGITFLAILMVFGVRGIAWKRPESDHRHKIRKSDKSMA
ncbi:hypothetical protein TWF696_004177 [Orbilia brochopaga]|uniref:Ankyrin repeat protein n=1 Tax=Orbilia brochopaga TaxID=3140254 RepID=A0AAV9VBV3_9PEZI